MPSLCPHADDCGCSECFPRPTRDHAPDRDNGPHEFTETRRGYAARERWARAYDDLNGAPESDGDR